MTLVLIITSAILLLAVTYFAYGKFVATDKLQDYIAKYESVKNYAETLTVQQVVTNEPTAVKEKPKKAKQPAEETKKVAKVKANAMPTMPNRRGRKPKMI